MQVLVNGLTKRYRDADRELTVISELSFAFPEKGTVAIIGRSGIGKSTFLNLLAGLDTPTTGSVRYGDTDISKLSSDERAFFRAKNLGFIFQFHHLLPEFNALENVILPLTMTGVPDRTAVNKGRELLERMGLSSRISHLPSQLSGGEQQRVAIARALVSQPPVVLADEPTGNLDVETAADVQKILLETNRELGNTLIVVTHNQELARNMDLVVEMMPGGGLQRRESFREGEYV